MSGTGFCAFCLSRVPPVGLIGLDLQRFKRKLHKNTPRRGGSGAAVWLWLLALFRRAVPSAAVWLRCWDDLFIWPRSDAGPYTFQRVGCLMLAFCAFCLSRVPPVGLIGLDLQRFKRKLHKNTPRRGVGPRSGFGC